MKRISMRTVALVLTFFMILPLFAAFEFTISADETDPSYPENIAYGKPTRSNSAEGEPDYIVDGKTNTSWVGDSYPGYVDIDLLDNYEISKITVVLPDGVWGYKIYGSLDGVSFKEISSHPFSETLPAGDDFAYTNNNLYRIIRINITATPGGSDASPSISEIRIFGTKSDTAVTPTRDKIEFTSYSEWLKENYDIELSENYTAADTYTENDTKEAIYGIIDRLLGKNYRNWFSFEISSGIKDYYEISMKNGIVNIRGNKGVSITAGLNYYLKYYCNVHISQQTKQVAMPNTIPEMNGSIKNETDCSVRYAYSYCTLSYTMPFFGYDEWQRELDYLALSGVTVILDTTATEALWVDFLQQFGYSADEAKNFICGYSYKAWWLMGNLESYGGSVSDSWIKDTLSLARTNQRFMTVLGIKPCLQGFMGTLPSTFASVAKENLINRGYSDITNYMVAQGTWSGFNRPPLLKTNYDGYQALADAFYDTQKALYGNITDYYAGELAHEGGIIPSDLSRSKMSSEILKHMMSNDSDAVWVIQCFSDNPEKAVLDAFGENRAEHILLLDLNCTATATQNYLNTTQWGGKEWNGSGWVFCMLDNYGGSPNVHGDLEYMASEFLKATSNSEHLKGIGLVSEGTQMNPVVQELLWELPWSESIDINEWISKYIERRYGSQSENLINAWKILLDTAYGYSGAHDFSANSVVNFSPSTISGSFVLDYDAEEFERAVGLFIEDFYYFKNNECYIYDLVDLLKQLLTNSMGYYFNTLVLAHAEENTEAFSVAKDKFLNSVILMDEVCQYQKDSMAGTWIGRTSAWCSSSKTGTYDDYDKYMMEINAKALTTVWSSIALRTYAYKQYSGQLLDYNYLMWENWLNALEEGSELPDASDDFRFAWTYVTNEGAYSSKVLDPAGGSINRGLHTIWNEISDLYLSGNAPVLDSVKYNIALRGEGYAMTENPENPSSRLNDGDYFALWTAAQTAGTLVPSYAGITLDGDYYVNEVIIVSDMQATPGTGIMELSIQAKQSGEFVTVWEGQSYDPETETYIVHAVFEEPVLTNDIRVNITKIDGSGRPAFAEIKVLSYYSLDYDETVTDSVFNDENQTLYIKKNGISVSSLKDMFTAVDGEMTVWDENGNELPDTAIITGNCTLKLIKNGYTFDAVNIILDVVAVTTPTPTPTPEPSESETAEIPETLLSPDGTDTPSAPSVPDNDDEPQGSIIIILIIITIICGAVVLLIIVFKNKSKFE